MDGSSLPIAGKVLCTGENWLTNYDIALDWLDAEV
jgi:hypothetical protein